MISIPIYSQRDDQWGDLELGTSGLKVRDDGCTSVAAAACLGVDPINFVTKMNANGGYTPGGLLRWDVAASLFDGNYIRGDWGADPADLSWINNLIAQGFPVILETRFPGSYDDTERSKTTHMHFVVAVDNINNGTDFTINDPWFSDQVSFSSRYGDPTRWIYAGNCFQKLPESNDYMGHSKEYWLQIEKDRADLLQQVGTLKTQVQEIGVQLDAETAKSKSLTDFVNSLAQLLNVPAQQSEITRAITEDMSAQDTIAKLNQQITTLSNEVMSANVQATQLKSDNIDLTNKLKLANDLQSQTAQKLQEVTKEYQDLVASIGETPLFSIPLGVIKIRVYRG